MGLLAMAWGREKIISHVYLQLLNLWVCVRKVLKSFVPNRTDFIFQKAEFGHHVMGGHERGVRGWWPVVWFVVLLYYRCWYWYWLEGVSAGTGTGWKGSVLVLVLVLAGTGTGWKGSVGGIGFGLVLLAALA